MGGRRRKKSDWSETISHSSPLTKRDIGAIINLNTCLKGPLELS